MKITFLGDCALMMEAVSISEMSVHFYQTTRSNIPEDNHLQFAGPLGGEIGPSVGCTCIEEHNNEIEML
jgi:hypothetical protein